MVESTDQVCVMHEAVVGAAPAPLKEDDVMCALSMLAGDHELLAGLVGDGERHEGRIAEVLPNVGELDRIVIEAAVARIGSAIREIGRAVDRARSGGH